MSELHKTTVLICGAGPTGLMMAAQLARYKVPFRIFDKNIQHRTIGSGALFLHARTLEIFHQMGIAAEALMQGMIVRRISFINKGKMFASLKVHDFGRGISRFPYVVMLKQSKTEQLLSDFIMQSGYEVEWNTELFDIRDSERGVHASLRTAFGDHQEVFCSWFVGADGGRSVTRKLLNIPFIEERDAEPLFILDCAAAPNSQNGSLYFSFSKNSTTGFFSLPNGRWRIDGSLPKALHLKEGLTYKDVLPYLSNRVGLPLKIADVTWFSVFHVHNTRSMLLQKEHCFLAGDAARVQNPVGAQGMNTGMQDACNLAWKLAHVYSGRASSKLLLSYEEERLDAAGKLTDTTTFIYRVLTGKAARYIFFRNIILKHLVSLTVYVLTRFKRFQSGLFKDISQIGLQYHNSSAVFNSGKFSKQAPEAGACLPNLSYVEHGKKVFLQDMVTDDKYTLLVLEREQPRAKTLFQEAYFQDILNLWYLPYQPNTVDIYRKLGVITYGCFLVRPDNYIAVRCCLHEVENIQRYFECFYPETSSKIEKNAVHIS